MLQLALAALLAGSLITGSPDGDKDKDKDKAKAQEPIESIIVPAEEDPILDTYALGRTERIPIKLWVGYSWGQDDKAYTPNGDEFDIPEVTAQRALVGAQINVINFTNFSVGAGGQLIAAQNKLTGANPAGGDLDSGFSLQNVKAYGVIRGRTLALHGGYIFDLGPDGTVAELAANGETANSDQVDAWFVGADFDYPSERVRVFAGSTTSTATSWPRWSRTVHRGRRDHRVHGRRWAQDLVGRDRRGRPAPHEPRHQPARRCRRVGATKARSHPYLRLSPPSFPVSISVKGAVLSEYADYGYSLGGGADLVTKKGFTVTASLGF